VRSGDSAEQQADCSRSYENGAVSIEPAEAQLESAPPSKKRSQADAVDFSKPMRSTLIALAIPVMASNLLTTIVSYVDFYMIQNLGKEAQAGFSMSRSGIFIVNSVFMGVSIGAAAYVARTLGAGEREKSRRYAAQAVMLSVYLSFPIMLFGFALGPHLFKMLGAYGMEADYGWDYLSIIFLGISVFGMRFVTNGVFNALGQTRVPMYLNIVFNIANVIGNLLMIPRWGVMGSAFSTIGTCALVQFWAVFILAKRGLASFTLSHFKGAERAIKNMFKLGTPMILQVVSRQGAMMAMFKIIYLTPGTTVGAATLGLGIIGESISFMPGLAIMVATSTIVGQALGAMRKEKAFEAWTEAAKFATIVMSLCGLVFFVFARPLVDFFSNDPGVIAEGVRYLRINVIAQPLMALTYAGVGCLRGAGDTTFPFLNTLIALYIVRIPVVYLLAVTLGYGLPGIWWGMVISNFVEMAVIVYRVSRKKWLSIELKY
jgi:putative MATE family efflux protein